MEAKQRQLPDGEEAKEVCEDAVSGGGERALAGLKYGNELFDCIAFSISDRQLLKKTKSKTSKLFL